MKSSFFRLSGAFQPRTGVLLLAFLVLPRSVGAYSVLTHEAIIDSAWDASIKPLLIKKYPQATPADVQNSHAYAYAGCILQDMGYYPFGSKFFSDLLHYVRSGDFVVNLVHSASNLNEYAFALGALAHYAADNQGHPVAVNRAVALQFPKLEKKFGQTVTYADKPSAHLQVEFGFDVLQIAHGNYAPQAYHDFIGFEVARPVLERAFAQTYGLALTDVFSNLDLALSTYRHTVSAIIPTVTRAAWQTRKSELQKAQPGLTKRQFIYNISRASYQKEWAGAYKKPGIAVRVLGFIIHILPKVGPLRALAFRSPTPQTDALFQNSFDLTLTEYRRLLTNEAGGTLQLDNRDFDTGAPTRPAEYKLADNTYSELVIKLANKTSDVDASVRDNVLAFYSDLNAAFATKSDAAKWKNTLAALDKLKQARP